MQSPGPVHQTSSRRQASLCSRQVQCCRSRADDLEMIERERREHMKAQTCFGTRETEKRGHEGSTAFSRRCTAATKRKGNSRKALTGGLPRSRDRIQRRGDGRVQGMSVRTRRAIAAGPQCADTTKQTTIPGMLLLSQF